MLMFRCGMFQATNTWHYQSSGRQFPRGAGLGRSVWVSAEHLMNLVDSTGARWLFLCSHIVAKVFLVLRQASMNP